MFEIRGTKIVLTQGDSAAFELDITRIFADEKREPFDINPGDKLYFTARKNLREITPVALEIIATGNARFVFESEMTNGISPGTYVYDIELHPATGGKYTIIDTAELEIVQGVRR